jgi:hypothetical protein
MIEYHRDSKFFGLICRSDRKIVSYWPLILSKRSLGYRLQNIGQEISDYACPSYAPKDPDIQMTILLGMLQAIESHKRKFSFAQLNNFLLPESTDSNAFDDYYKKSKSWSISNTRENFFIASEKYGFSSSNWFSLRLSKNVKKNIRHEGNVLAKLGLIEIKDYDSADQLARLKDNYYQWYQYQNKTIASKKLVVNVLHLDSHPISLIFGFRRNNEFDLFSLCYNPKYASYSPGKQHLFQFINQKIDAKTERINFLTGNEAYKMSYASDNYKTFDLKLHHMSNLTGIIQRIKK